MHNACAQERRGDREGLGTLQVGRHRALRVHLPVLSIHVSTSITLLSHANTSLILSPAQGRVRILKRLRVPVDGAAHADERSRQQRYPFFFDELGHFVLPRHLHSGPEAQALAVGAARGGGGSQCAAHSFFLRLFARRERTSRKTTIIYTVRGPFQTQSTGTLSNVQYNSSGFMHYAVAGITRTTTGSRGSRATSSTRATCSAVSRSACHLVSSSTVGASLTHYCTLRVLTHSSHANGEEKYLL